MRYFDTEPTAISRARQAYLILIGCAARHETFPYNELGRRMGYTSPNHGAGAMGNKLGPLLYYCEQQGLPPLTSIVVDSETGLPGDGAQMENVPAVQQKVFRHDWFAHDVPTEEELRRAPQGNI